MNPNTPTLTSISPNWEAISDKYESLFSALREGVIEPVKRREKEESLFWEQFGFELMITMLSAQRIPFETSVDDVQPIVEDLNGIKKEIDFRIHILGKEVYFGVTHFYGRPKDLRKDVEKIDVPIFETMQNGMLQPEIGKIVEIRRQTEYLNRRMVVRIAREGKHRFNNDYIYIMFPKTDLGFGGGMEGLSKNFTFTTRANYEYRPHGITGLILFGKFIEITSMGSNLQEHMLMTRTLSFDKCSVLMKSVLDDFDMTTINQQTRIEQVNALLRQGNN